MLRWIRNRVGQRNFNRAWREAAEEKYDQGEIAPEQYIQCIKAADSPEVMRVARNQLRADPNMLGDDSDWSFEELFQWFIDYFIPAMEVIIPILITLLDTEEDEE